MEGNLEGKKERKPRDGGERFVGEGGIAKAE